MDGGWSAGDGDVPDHDVDGGLAAGLGQFACGQTFFAPYDPVATIPVGDLKSLDTHCGACVLRCRGFGDGERGQRRLVGQPAHVGLGGLRAGRQYAAAAVVDRAEQ